MADSEFDAGSNGDLTYATHSAAAYLHEGKMARARRKHERWPDDERERITAESFEPGTTISACARRNDVSLGLLHYWRRMARKTGSVEELRFVPVAVEHAVAPPSSAAIEIIVGDARIRIDGDVCVDRLRSVLAAVRG